jgi:hypothetical protein
VRACTSTELSAFLSPECSLSTASFGGVSLGIALLPGSVPGRTILSTLFRSLFHLSFQSSSTFRFSCSSHCSIGCPVQFSAHYFRAVPGVSIACWWFRVLARVRSRSCILMAVQAFLICLARPVFSSRAWNRATLLFNQRSSGGTYASVSSCLIGVVCRYIKLYNLCLRQNVG